MESKRKTPVGRFLDRKQAAEYIGLSDFWLEKHCNDHEGPRWFRHGRKCWYRKADLDVWLAERREARGEVASVWRASEARQIPAPKEKELEIAYVEEWGADELTTRDSAEEFLKRFMTSLSSKQLTLLARAKEATS